MRLDTFDHWKRCITIDCGLPLTAAFIAARIAALSDPRDEHTARFVEKWGEEHRQRVLGWFRQAAANEGSAQ